MKTFAIVDLETTGNSAHKGDRIIEVAIVIYRDGKIIKKYNQLINPETHISRFISYLTGITNEMVVDRPIFSEVAHEIYSHFENVYFVAHNVPFDLGFLNYELKNAGLPAITQPVIDTVELSRILLPQAPSFKLGHLSEWLGISHDDPHRALSDALVTTKLLDYLLKKLNCLPLTTIKHLKRLAPDFKSQLNEILSEQQEAAKQNKAINDRFNYAYNIAFKPIEASVRDNTIDQTLSFGEYLDTLFSEKSELRNQIANYEERPGQKEMAESIYHAFQSQQHALIEAGTGTGKTLAYLIAACYQATKQRQKVLISTYLIHLQQQILLQEWPQLQKALPFECDIAVLKGKDHYINLAKFSQALHEESYNYDQVLTKAILLIWLTETNTGDIDEIQLPASGEQLFKRISARNQAQHVKQDSYENIYYQTARKKAETADVLIINHSLLADAMKQDDGIIQSHDYLIVDEAHHLERVVANHYGLQINSIVYHKKLKSIEHFIENSLIENNQIKRSLQNFVNVAIESSELLFNFLFHYVDKYKKNNSSKNELGRSQVLIENKDHSDWLLIIEMAERLEFALYDLIRQLDQLNFNDLNQARKILFTEDLLTMKNSISEFFRSNVFNKQVKWIETERLGTQKVIYLYQQPLNTNQIIADDLNNRIKSIVYLSASLSVSGNFDFIKNELGLNNQHLLESNIISPFPFHEQVQLLIPNDFPIADYENFDPFIEATCELIFTMADITSGRMLILFNSYDMLRKAYYLLKEIFDEQYLLIAQGITSGSHERLKKNFQSFDKSILLGTNAFWEGLDIPGDDLSVVMMVRLPFESPNHPIVNQKHQLIAENGKNPFVSYSLPKAVIRFKQGFGRLIRSQSDRGIIVVCDDRIMTKSYGKAFTDSIPNVPIHHRRTNELLDITNDWFFNN